MAVVEAENVVVETRNAVVEVKNLVKQFGATPVVRNLSVSVGRGEILALLGSSGCGKTTTLRCIAGLETPTSGEIWIDGVQVAGGNRNLPAERRNVGMVFQSYAIWPHMTVAENVAYGLKVKRMAKSKIKDAVAQALALVMLDGLGSRYPAELSGGQQQRVALARSIVTEPTVLLLDEPLSNLDAKLREQMRGELRDMIKRAGITAVHITHDQAEAMAVADRVAVMDGGVIAQIGTAREIYRRPCSRFVAGFVGRANFLPATVVDADAAGTRLRTGGGLDVSAPPADWAAAGDQVTLALRPEDFELVRTGQQRATNSWPATMVRSQFLGPVVEYDFRIAGDRIQVSSPVDVSEEQVVGVSMLPEHIVVLRADDERAHDQRADDLGANDQRANDPRVNDLPAGDPRADPARPAPSARSAPDDQSPPVASAVVAHPGAGGSGH